MVDVVEYCSFSGQMFAGCRPADQSIYTSEIMGIHEIELVWQKASLIYIHHIADQMHFDKLLRAAKPPAPVYIGNN